MEAKNFRIGNIVDLFGQCEILAIGSKRIKVQRENKSGFIIEKCPLNSLSLNSFTLSKNWLKDFGCKESYWYISLPKLKAELHFEFFGDEIVTTLKSDYSNLILEPIKKVHELQNLFFALEGYELKFKQKVSDEH